MLWYAAFTKNNSINSFKNLKRKNKKSLYLRNIDTDVLKKKRNKYYFNYILPFSWNLFVLSNTKLNTICIIFYSKTYCVKLPILQGSEVSLSFDQLTNQVLLSTQFINNFVILYQTLFSMFYKAFIKPFFTKLKFKGKGYYIYKNYRNTITPQFGYSHRLYLYTFFTHISFLSKTSLISFGLNFKDIACISKILYSWRPLNIFTSRGVRFSKQVTYKKSGKVSSYR